MNKIKWNMNRNKRSHSSHLSAVSREAMTKALKFHRSIPGYSPTPLRTLSALSRHLGIKSIVVKDESYRFELNSFKVLGSSYAVAEYLAGTLGTELQTFLALKEKLINLPVKTFATATDGNHGRGLAWSAKMLGQNAIVYMPKGSSEYRLHAITDLGAEAEITSFNYDDTVCFASAIAPKQGWTLVQDTAWDGYHYVPALIMKGYLTIVGEFLDQYKSDAGPITHVILQAGVGSFAGAIAGILQQEIRSRLTFIVVEPTRADCLYQSSLSEDGSVRTASGDLSTIMAGLSCGEPNPFSWDILKNTVDCFISCPDETAARGMRILGNPLGEDSRIISGESGAIPVGVLFELCQNPDLHELKKLIRLDSSSKVLIINTEGDTDPAQYRQICWEGKYSSN